MLARPYSISYGSGRIISGQDDLIAVPRDGAQGLRPVLVMHGQLLGASEFANSGAPGSAAVFAAIAAAGLVAIAIYADGPMWGNPTALADMETARLYAVSTFGCASDKVLLVGASMGACDCFSYCRANPSKVAAVEGIIPAIDLNDLRDNNRNGNGTQYINAAWSLPVGSTSATVPLPSTANPSDPTNAATIKASGAAFRLDYSTADTVVIPSTVTNFATELGITANVVDTTTGHSETSIGSIPLQTVAAWLYSHAKAGT